MSVARARLLGVSSYLPPRVRTSAEVEALIAAASPDCRVRRGIVEAISGIRQRRVIDEGVQTSDLAVAAARSAFAKTGLAPNDIDQLIFASASQDLIEPATANIVQEKLGTRAPVFDIKNACNSFLNGLEMAEALVLSGSRRCVLVVSGETCSHSIAWHAADQDEFKMNFPGFTLGDAGAAAIVVPSNDRRGIFHRSFMSLSHHWPLATFLGGGSMHPHSVEHSYIRGDGSLLREACIREGPEILHRAMRAAGVDFDDFKRLFVHQVSLPYLRDFAEHARAPFDRIELTLPCFGNMASASLPVALAQAEERGAVGPGDKVLMVGMASGISIGVMMMEL